MAEEKKKATKKTTGKKAAAEKKPKATTKKSTKARKATVIVSEMRGEITVTVRDDGVGSSGYTEGIGLRGMRERMERLGGTLVTDTEHGGFMVRGTIPFRAGVPGSASGSGGNGRERGTGKDPAPDC